MAVEFIPVDRDTPYIFPPCVQDYLPDDHLARFVVDIVEQLDLSHLSAVYSGRGSKPFHPAMLVALLFYGYTTGVFSSRKLEKATYDSIAFRYICANTNPDHDTIASFRKRFLKEPPTPGPQAKDQVNLTDKESRIMPTASGGFEQAYHAQAGVDVETHLIVEQHVTQHTNDKQEIEPALEAIGHLPEALGEVENLLADTGYFSEANVEKCTETSLVPFIPEKREKHNLPLTERFREGPEPPQNATAVQTMRHRLQTREGKAVYAKRKSTVETVFGIIKQVQGFRQFLLRGLDSVQSERSLVYIGWNLNRMRALRG